MSCCEQDHSDLVRAWIEDARDSTQATASDRMVYALGHDRRLGHSRAVVVGAVVDGDPKRRGPGVVVCVLTVDGHWQEAGLTHVDHARAVIEALRLAWPELRTEASA